MGWLTSGFYFNRLSPWPRSSSPHLGKVGLTCRRSCGRVALAARHLCPVHGCWAPAPGPQAVLLRPGCGTTLLAQALSLSTRGHQKARVFSGPWPRYCAGWPPTGLQDCCRHHLCGCSGRRPVGGVHVASPRSCSCTPPPRESYWRCRGNHHTRSGCTGPRRQ